MVKPSAKGSQPQSRTESKLKAQEVIESGVLAVQRGHQQEAYEIFQSASKSHPNTSDVWVWLGGTSPDLDSAEAAFERAYALNPDNEQASLGLRWVRLRRKASLADIVGATVPVPITPETAEQAAQAAQPEGLELQPAAISNAVADQPHEQRLSWQAQTPQVDADADASQSAGGLNTRVIIIAVVLLVLAAAVALALWYLNAS